MIILNEQREQSSLPFSSERKVQPNEYPHSLYIANYSTAAATCLVVKRWLFDLDTELATYEDPVSLEFVFQEAIENVNRGHIGTEDKLYHLKALQEANKKAEVCVHFDSISNLM
jgi:sorting nexin-27